MNGLEAIFLSLQSIFFKYGTFKMTMFKHGEIPILRLSGLRARPSHTKDFFGVSAKTRGIFLGSHDIQGRREIFRAAFSSSFGVDEFRRGGISVACMACDVIFENFENNY